MSSGLNDGKRKVINVVQHGFGMVGHMSCFASPKGCMSSDDEHWSTQSKSTTWSSG